MCQETMDRTAHASDRQPIAPQPQPTPTPACKSAFVHAGMALRLALPGSSPRAQPPLPLPSGRAAGGEGRPPPPTPPRRPPPAVAALPRTGPGRPPPARSSPRSAEGGRLHARPGPHARPARAGRLREARCASHRHCGRTDERAGGGPGAPALHARPAWGAGASRGRAVAHVQPPAPGPVAGPGVRGDRPRG